MGSLSQSLFVPLTAYYPLDRPLIATYATPLRPTLPAFHLSNPPFFSTALNDQFAESGTITDSSERH